MSKKDLVETDHVLRFVRFQGVDPPSRLPQTDDARQWRAYVARTSLQMPVVKEVSVTLHPFVAWLLAAGGLPADAYRALPLHRRLPALLRHLRVASPEAAHSLLNARPELVPGELNCLLIGVSFFFRDATVFNYLRSEVLPRLLMRRQGVRIFGAGVSSGHELYSVAILLAEMGMLERSSLLGIDCRPEAIERAEQGLFSDEELAGVDGGWQMRYFRPEQKGWRANPRLRKSIQWQRADIISFSPPPCDLVLFRNVAIYLEARTATIVWEKLVTALSPGGYLITGKAEKPVSALPLQCLSKSVYQRGNITP